MNPKFKPPKEFFNYLKSEYSRSHYGYTGYRIEPYIFEKLLCAAYGITAWILSKGGAEWIFKIVGVKEIPTHHGYKYYFRSTNSSERRLIDRNKIRIFKKISDTTGDVGVEALEMAKRVVFAEGWKLPEDKTFMFIFGTYREWVKRTAGKQWIRERFSPIKYLEIFGEIAYRCGSYTGEVFWVSKDQVVSEPNEENPCECCDCSYPCVENYTGLGSICNRCYAENLVENEVLEMCNRHECKDHECHNYLSDDRMIETSNEIEEFPIQWRDHG